MITLNEIKEEARTNGVPVSTIERDYVQDWLLKYLSQIDEMVLKGGTGIRKVYFFDYRFSDDLDFTLIEEVKVDDIKREYSLEEIIAEKIRSVFQRTRPRDLYDLWYLWNRVDLRKAFNILPEKLKLKNIESDISDLEKRRDDFKNAWENSLRHQLKELPVFDEVFDRIKIRMEEVCKWKK